MSAELQWELVRNHNAFVTRRSGISFSREAGNLVQKHSYKYSGLAHQKTIAITAVPEGVSITRRSAKVPANKVSKSMVKPTIIGKKAIGGVRAVKLSRDMQATGYRLDLTQAAQAKVCALLRSFKPRKNTTQRLSARKLAKLSKKN